ncbi:MAG: hypothetical protein FWF23_03580 [Alphaproteobacteria bacterium]|nr:hypothetical protein [Alphaproteobacteria bacterium]MCL2505721.1 hypothetical protein [Alphaproteobacteria bacterium]
MEEKKADEAEPEVEKFSLTLNASSMRKFERSFFTKKLRLRRYTVLIGAVLLLATGFSLCYFMFLPQEQGAVKTVAVENVIADLMVEGFPNEKLIIPVKPSKSWTVIVHEEPEELSLDTVKSSINYSNIEKDIARLEKVAAKGEDILKLAVMYEMTADIDAAIEWYSKAANFSYDSVPYDIEEVNEKLSDLLEIQNQMRQAVEQEVYR